MQISQIEAWALRVIQQVEAKQPNEDAHVELKGKWPEDHKKAARRIAGHANAARGEPILWLIGLDQDQGVKGADSKELATWFPIIKAEFDGLAPTLVDVNVPWKGQMVVALLFDTGRAPFVVKNPVFGQKDGGPVELEVPWREGTKVRTADRSELLMLLVPAVRVPGFEILGAWARAVLNPTTTAPPEQLFAWEIVVTLYVSPKGEVPVTIPFHRCKATFEIPGCLPRTVPKRLELTPPGSGERFKYQPSKDKNLSLTIERTLDEVLINGPGKLHLALEAVTGALPTGHDGELHVIASLAPLDTTSAMLIDVALSPKMVDARAGPLQAAWDFNDQMPYLPPKPGVPTVLPSERR